MDSNAKWSMSSIDHFALLGCDIKLKNVNKEGFFAAFEDML
jgi:hypothetical protein